MPTTFVRLTLPAQISALQQLCAFVRRGAEASALAPEEMDKLDLVLEEIFVNIARYAYPDTRNGVVEVGYAVDAPGRLLVQISDSGRVFNPLNSNPADINRGLSDRPIGGLGIFLVKSIADSIHYERDGNRNKLSFTFCGSVRAGS